MVEKELRKLELLCGYANKLVGKAGLNDQKEKSKLYGVDNYQYFKRLLYVNKVYPHFNGNAGVFFSIRRQLSKRLSELNDEIVYITLLEARHGENYRSDFYYYETKKDMDECESIAKLKSTVRSMIKNPEKFFRSE